MTEVLAYRDRVVDGEIGRALSTSMTLVLEGAKGVGTTVFAKEHSWSAVLFDIDEVARQAAEVEPSLVLAKEFPRLIDEWQEVPRIWNLVRRAVDGRADPFILTGSTLPSDHASRHTGADRFA
jgi:hypothetical protein